MKHTMIFAVLLCMILSLGYFSVDLSDRLIKDPHPENITVERNGQDKDTILLSTAETGFDPMNILGRPIERNSSAIKYECNIAAAIIAGMSFVDDPTAYNYGAVRDLPSAIRVSSNDYLFVRHYEYYNFNEDIRYVDCIITRYTFNVIYIRFYSPDDSEPLPEQVSAELEQISNNADNFFSSRHEINSTIDDVMQKMYDEFYYEDYNGTVFFAEEANYELLCENYSIVCEYLRNFFTDADPLTQFMTWGLGLSRVSFPTYTHYDSGYADATQRIFDKIVSAETIGESEFTAYKGCIYQTTYIGKSLLTIIYNASYGGVEGFFAPEM